MNTRRHALRALVGAALLVALILLLAWWLRPAPRSHPQARSGTTPVQHERARTSAVRVAPDASVPDAAPPDAAVVSPSEAAFVAMLVPAMCAQRDRCGCGAYPPPFASAQDLEGATTCEADLARDLHLWWASHVTSPVVMLEGAALAARLEHNLGCADFHGSPMDFLRADAETSEACGSAPFCRDGSRCQHGICLDSPGLGEPCIDGAQHQQSPNRGRRERVRCAEGLVCVEERCAPASTPVGRLSVCPPGTLQRPVQRDPWDTRPTECIPVNTPCTSSYDCGTGLCAGTALPRRCMAPGPLLGPELALSCDAGESCARCGCQAGFSCDRRADPPACVPIVQEGEPCEEARCASGLRCATYVPEGQCIAQMCRQTHPFGRDLRPHATIEDAHRRQHRRQQAQPSGI